MLPGTSEALGGCHDNKSAVELMGETWRLVGGEVGAEVWEGGGRSFDDSNARQLAKIRAIQCSLAIAKALI